MTWHSVVSDKLIELPYLSRSPDASVLLCLSEPARSTIFNFPMWMCYFKSAPISLHSTINWKRAWLRELLSFILVSPVTLLLAPISSSFLTSFSLFTVFDVKSLTNTPVSGFYRISSFFSTSLLKRSWMFSIYISR